MPQNCENSLGFVRHLQRLGNFIGGHSPRLSRQQLHHCGLQRNYASCGLLAGFHARLVVGVDVDQAGVQADRAFEERNQCPDRKGIDPVNGDGHRFASLVVQSPPCALEEAEQEVPAGYPLLNPHRS